MTWLLISVLTNHAVLQKVLYVEWSFYRLGYCYCLCVILFVTAYEEQVVAFFRQQDIVAIISGRYQRGVRPQLRDIIAGIRMEGTTALERIQMSGSIAAYELAIVLR